MSISNIERRKMAAYWYAVGWSGATGEEDRSDDFAKFVEAETTAYETGETSTLQSVPDQWKRFNEDRARHAFDPVNGHPSATACLKCKHTPGHKIHKVSA